MKNLGRFTLFALCLVGFLTTGYGQVPELINYQGRLLDENFPVNASTQVVFRLYDLPAAGNLYYAETQTVDVADGFYSTNLGLSNAVPGSLFSALTNATVYFELQVGDAILSPRERMVSVAYAQLAAGVVDHAITSEMLAPGLDSSATNEVNHAVSLVGTTLNLTDAAGTLTADLSGLSVDTNAVRIAGDVMSGALTNLLGITSPEYFNSKNTAGGDHACALGGIGNAASAAGSVISGGASNTVIGLYSSVGGGAGNTAGNAASDRHIVIAGGVDNSVTDHHSVIGGGRQNRVTQEYSTIAGGYTNVIENTYSFIGGGRFNRIRARDNVIGGGGHNLIDIGDIFSVVGGGESNKIHNDRCFIGGGRGNVASNIYVTIGGGDKNVARGDSATISGGWTNYIGSADAAVIAGGRGNKIHNNCDYSTIPGGRGNIIDNSADYAFAGGRGAHVTHDGTFMWADHNSSPRLYSTAENQFIVRASGGVIFYSANNTTAGVRLPSGSGSWSSLSDRNAKTDVKPLDSVQVLKTLCTIPVQTWRYKDQTADIRHAGPMAQDFYAAFKLGEDDRHISSMDADGIALSAIQGLHKITREENAQLKERMDQQALELDALKKRLLEIEVRIKGQSSAGK